MKPTDERELFARLILALGPYRSDVVLIGGWAHRLFRLHPLSQLVDFPPLLTQDVDWSGPRASLGRSIPPRFKGCARPRRTSSRRSPTSRVVQTALREMPAAR